MSDTTVYRQGQDNLSGSATANLLTLAAGEILKRLRDKYFLEQMIPTRPGRDAPAYQWDVMGGAFGSYHTLGKRVSDSANSYLSTIPMSKRTINADAEFISAKVLSNYDELISHLPDEGLRGACVEELADALARKTEQKILQQVIKAARATKTISDQSGYPTIADNSSFGTVSFSTASEIRSAIGTAAKTLRKNKVTGKLVAVLGWDEFHTLRTDETSTLNRDVNGGGKNNTQDIDSVDVMGVMVVPSTIAENVFGVDLSSAVTGENNSYEGDFTYTKGVVFSVEESESPIGRVSFEDVTVEMAGADLAVDLRGPMMVASRVEGIGILRPESAIELKIAS